MQTGLVLEAQFVTNPFVLLKGAYNGLFYETNETGGADCERVDTAGFFTFTLADRGTYTATLLLAGKRFAASGALNLEGEATNVIRLNASNSLRVAWHVLRDGSDVIEGSVTSLSNAVWTAKLMGDRAVFHATTRPATNFAGRYTWLVPGRPEAAATLPGGDSHGTAVIDRGGMVTVAGSLADSAVLSQRVPVNKNGMWPFYAAPYAGGKGVIFGWANIDTNRPNDDLHGDLCWLRLTNMLPRVYTNGLRYETNLVGAIYRPPVGTTSRIINVATGEVVFAGGYLSDALTNMVRVGPNNRVTNDGPNVLTLTLTPASGLFTGTMTVTNAGSTIPRRLTFKGALLQKPAPGYGGGFFIDTNRSGQVIVREKLVAP
jgi:hypothetical protein